jgi:LEA14-like dessication related protein
VWASLVAAGLLAGCVTTPDPEGFDVSLVNLAGGNATLWETEAVVTVRLQNATPNDIRITGAAHKLYLNRTYVGQGLSSEEVTVPRLGTTTQNITVHLKNFTVVRKLIGVQETRSASYKVQSTIYGNIAGGTPQRFRAVKEGSVNLDQFLPAPQGPGSGQ